ncbi:MAG: orotate phosphoribosyltransferase [Solidesulfovibrio magneticus str. Maddingley MBC34]|uniref:Orotate phosphoribosyltransferase n=1 Tax=Solidesulfovibrio magneticus str. Maddingley MBC34 TaxID=1206767 RepID=K6GBY3_9BACT|nr:MAG: orotate phosphoribosyltransferase [Solidesulfovibrio magneticus str. Maddingley MBC34]
MIALTQALIERFWEAGAVMVRDAPITLKSGRESHVYVSLRDFVCEAANLALLGDVFGEWLEGRTLTLGSVSSLLSPVLCGAFAGRFDLPLALFRGDASEKGLSGQVFGGEKGAPVVLVDDVLTSGGTAVAAARAFVDQGLGQPSLFVFVDKRPESLRGKFPLPVIAPLTLGELLGHGIQAGCLSGETVGFAEEELTFLAG